MDSLKRFREPLVLVVLVAVGVRVILTLVSAGVYVAQGLTGGIVGVTGLVASRAGDPALIVLLTALVASCVLVDPTPRVRGLALAALVAVSASVLVGFFFGVLGFSSGSAIPVVNAGYALIGLVAPAVCLVLLFTFVGLGRAVASSSTPYALPSASTPPHPAPEQPEQSGAWRDEPTWQPDAAAGASWQTAGDAAAGAPASAWGTPGQQGDWQPQPPPQPYVEHPPSDQGQWPPGPPPTSWSPPPRP